MLAGTSQSAWCNHDACLNSKHVQSLTQRIANITGIHSANQEFFQVWLLRGVGMHPANQEFV